MKKKTHSESEMVKAVKELESDTVQLEVEVQRNGCEPGQKLH